MKITHVKSRAYSIPFTIPLRTAYGNIDNRCGLILCAETESGKTGYGEIAPLEEFSKETFQEAAAAADALPGILQSRTVPCTPDELREFTAAVNTEISLPASVRFGMESLLCDLAGQKANLPMYKWFRNTNVTQIPVAGLLSGSAEEISNQLSEKLDRGFLTYKLKLTGQSLHSDIRKVELVREKAGHSIAIRIDANKAWTFDYAIQFLTGIQECNVAFVEEPLEQATYDALHRLRTASTIPIALDETFVSSENKDALLSGSCCDIIILKPTVIGGLLETIRIARTAQFYNIKSVISSALESGIGIATLLHLSAILSDTVLPGGLDTLYLLQDPLIETPLQVTRGKMPLPSGAGLGISVKRN